MERWRICGSSSQDIFLFQSRRKAERKMFHQRDKQGCQDFNRSLPLRFRNKTKRKLNEQGIYPQEQHHVELRNGEKRVIVLLLQKEST